MYVCMYVHMLSVVCRLLSVVCCLLSVVCWLLYGGGGGCCCYFTRCARSTPIPFSSDAKDGWHCAAAALSQRRIENERYEPNGCVHGWSEHWRHERMVLNCAPTWKMIMLLLLFGVRYCLLCVVCCVICIVCCVLCIVC